MAVDVDLGKQAPQHPRAPSQEGWAAMTPAQRRAAADALPAWMTDAELSPPEGDAHFDAKVEGRDTLRTYFERLGRRVYVGAELTVYYPDEDRFAPDLFAVCDVDVRPQARLEAERAAWEEAEAYAKEIEAENARLRAEIERLRQGG